MKVQIVRHNDRADDPYRLKQHFTIVTHSSVPWDKHTPHDVQLRRRGDDVLKDSETILVQRRFGASGSSREIIYLVAESDSHDRD